MKVLHIFGQMARHGAELRTLELYNVLREKGVHCDFCSLSHLPGELDNAIRQMGSHVIHCPVTKQRLSFNWRFVELLKKTDYDIVHSHVDFRSGNIVRLAHKADVGVRIVHIRNTRDATEKWLRKRYCNIMVAMAKAHATGALAVCKGAMESFWGSDWESDKRCQVIYNGLDRTPFEKSLYTKEMLLKELQIPADARLLAHVGRFYPQKAHSFLIDVFSEIAAKRPDVHLLLVGDGPLRSSIQGKCRAAGVSGKVHFLGERNDVPQLLKHVDCFVLPSLWEGLPGVVLESLAAGVTVVASDLPGVREIADYTSLVSVVSSGSTEKMADGVLKALFSAEADKNVPFPREFCLEVCAEKVFDYYCRQLNSAKA